jgi:hypothetical protein
MSLDNITSNIDVKILTGYSITGEPQFTRKSLNSSLSGEGKTFAECMWTKGPPPSPVIVDGPKVAVQAIADAIRENADSPKLESLIDSLILSYGTLSVQFTALATASTTPPGSPLTPLGAGFTAIAAEYTRAIAELSALRLDPTRPILN